MSPPAWSPLHTWCDSVLGVARGTRPSGPLRPDYSAVAGVADAVLRRRHEDDLRILRERLRVGVLLVLGFVFGTAIAVDPFAHPDKLRELWVIKAAMLLTCAWAWHASSSGSRGPMIRGTVIMVVVVGVGTSLSSIVVGEDWSAAICCMLLAVACAGLLPWGVRVQLFLAPVLLVFGMLPTLFVGDGTKIAFIGMISLLFVATSVLIAQEQERFRRATWQSLLFFRENMERLRQIAEHINGVLWLGERGDWGEAFLYVSPRYDELWGLDRKVLQERPDAWLDAVHPEDRARVKQEFSAGAALGDYACEYRLRRPDGALSWIRDYGFPIRDVEGRTRRVARLSQDVTAEREAASASQMREIARSIQAAQEDERRRIARELHDELGQALTGIKLRLASVGMLAADPAGDAAPAIDACVCEVDEAMRSVHGMIHRLHPPILDDLGLLAALRMQAETFARRTGIVCDLELPELEPELSQAELSAVFRVAQESLTNVARHADAKHVALTLSAQADGLRLLVADDGRGLGDAKQGFGLRGMGERAALLNGTLQIEPRPERGTLVRLDLPRTTPEASHVAAHPARR